MTCCEPINSTQGHPNSVSQSHKRAARIDRPAEIEDYQVGSIRICLWSTHTFLWASRSLYSSLACFILEFETQIQTEWILKPQLHLQWYTKPQWWHISCHGFWPETPRKSAYQFGIGVVWCGSLAFLGMTWADISVYLNKTVAGCHFRGVWHI